MPVIWRAWWHAVPAAPLFFFTHLINYLSLPSLTIPRHPFSSIFIYPGITGMPADGRWTWMEMISLLFFFYSLYIIEKMPMFGDGTLFVFSSVFSMVRMSLMEEFWQARHVMAFSMRHRTAYLFLCLLISFMCLPFTLIPAPPWHFWRGIFWEIIRTRMTFCCSLPCCHAMPAHQTMWIITCHLFPFTQHLPIFTIIFTTGLSVLSGDWWDWAGGFSNRHPTIFPIFPPGRSDGCFQMGWWWFWWINFVTLYIPMPSSSQHILIITLNELLNTTAQTMTTMTPTRCVDVLRQPVMDGIMMIRALTDDAHRAYWCRITLPLMTRCMMTVYAMIGGYPACHEYVAWRHRPARLAAVVLDATCRLGGLQPIWKTSQPIMSPSGWPATIERAWSAHYFLNDGDDGDHFFVPCRTVLWTGWFRHRRGARRSGFWLLSLPSLTVVSIIIIEATGHALDDWLFSWTWLPSCRQAVTDTAYYFAFSH